MIDFSKEILLNLTIKDLEDKIKEANEFYRDGTPILADYVYDKIVDRLKELSPDHEWFKKAVQDKTKREKEKLPFEMFSLDKLKSIGDIEEWLKKKVGDNYTNTELIITPKFDGLSIQKDCSTGKSLTRGNGVEGEDCTPQMGCFSENVYSEYLDLTVRGEVCITNQDWVEFKNLFPNYKSQRNTATGLIKGYYAKEEKPKYVYLSYISYDLYESVKSKEQQLTFLNENVNYVECPYKKVPFIYLSERYLKKTFEEWQKEFPLDGLVLDIDDPKYRVGQETNGNPTYQKSYKHPSFTESKVTKIIDIELNINRFGVVTPVCVINPVELSGAEINRVNGINMSYIFDWGLFPGQYVRILRSGEVIPKIIEVENVRIPFKEDFRSISEYKDDYLNQLTQRREDVNKSELIYNGRFCPSCGSQLSWDKTYTNLVCKNEDCEEKKLQSIVEFFRIIGFEGFGEKTFRQLYEEGFKDIMSILKINPNCLIPLNGWAKTSIDQFCKEMKRVQENKIPLARLLHASGFFNGLGEKTLQLILDDTKDFRSPINSELLEIKGVSEITANTYEYGIEKFNETLLGFLFNVSFIKTPTKEIGGKLSGETIVFTGFRDKELEETLKKEGAIIGDGITKQTTILITKDDNLTTKVKKAQENGIKIFTKEKFLIFYL